MYMTPICGLDRLYARETSVPVSETHVPERSYEDRQGRGMLLPEKLAHPEGVTLRGDNNSLGWQTGSQKPTDFRAVPASLANRKVPALTGFDWLEAEMACSFAQREDGWPVGHILRERAWSCATPTVQIVERDCRLGRQRFVVHTLFPFLRTDRRYRSMVPLTLAQARRYAFARLRELSPDGSIRTGRGPGIEWCRGGSHIGFEVLR